MTSDPKKEPEGQQYGEGNYKATRDYDRGPGTRPAPRHREGSATPRRVRGRSQRDGDAERAGRERARGSSAKDEDDPNVN
jgi:hypothetical protein